MRDLIEHVECDADFSSALADLGGYNYLGDPVFRLVWSQAVRMETPGATIYVEEPVPGMNQPCWALQRWLPPEAYGTPELYETLFKDEETGLMLTGPYPEFGRYETVIVFKNAHFNESLKRIIIETIPLDWDILELALPMLLRCQEMTAIQVKTMKDAEKEALEQAKLSSMEDRLYDALPSFYGPTSYAGQRIKTALIDREMSKVERQWKLLPKHLRKAPPRGFFQN